MWKPEGNYTRIGILAALVVLTLSIHYGWIFEPLFGHPQWFHSLHGRFCYIPIVVAAAWFGLRGGILAAAVISILVLPYIFRTPLCTPELIGEYVEIVFYFALAALVGALIEREFRARRKQQEAELQVERSQKLSLVGQIAAGVAHEIKNPLASIKGAADILTDENTTSEARDEFGQILQKEVKRIDSTVSEFLAFARPKETRLQQMNFSEIIHACVRQITGQARQANISLGSDIADNVIVNGDAEKLHQMTLNLALNAIQASKPRSHVDIRLSIDDRARARLEIIDSGEGIPPQDIDRVFEPFYTTKASGTGLGLAVVKSIVDNHHGDIAIRSSAGEGTTVTVTLPLWQERRKS